VHPPENGKDPTSADPRASLYFHYAFGLSHPNTRLVARLLGPCFKTGRMDTFCQDHEARVQTRIRMQADRHGHSKLSPHQQTHTRTRLQPPKRRALTPSVCTTDSQSGTVTGTQRKRQTPYLTPRPASRSSKPILAHPGAQGSGHPCGHPLKYASETGTASIRLPFINFRHFLTLFSKFFASFPHGTCSLSVSHKYLALDGIYHPL
jgi:hypothetical protein